MDAARRDQLAAKVLKEELREDENTREQNLEQFRDWILKNPDIRDCPTDDSFLLPFLRIRKHSVPMAEQSLLNLLKFLHNFPSSSCNLDIDDPDLNDVISSGYMFVSPFRDVNSNAVMAYYIPRNLDVKKHIHQTSTRAVLMNALSTVRLEDAQIFGSCNILDFNEVTPAFVACFPLTVIKSTMMALEKAVAIRSKKWHVINMPAVATWLMKTIMSAISEKLQKRFLVVPQLVGGTTGQHVDPAALPKEYGGTMPMEEMIGLWKKELAVHREYLRSLNNIKLVGDSFKNDLEYDDTGIPGLPGSFRKLAVD